MADPPTPRAFWAFAAAFVLGGLLALLGAEDAIDHLLDPEGVGVALLVGAIAGALAAWRWLPAARLRERAGNLAFGAISVAMAVSATFLVLERATVSEHAERVVTPVTGVVGTAAGRLVFVSLDGRPRSFASAHAPSCATGDTAHLRIGRSALGQRWLLGARCERAGRGPGAPSTPSR